ncbi:MAG: AbrB/MazE/SpoVT family DNA-binding domain-containing protein [Methylococcaceae bacterium]|nr:AbrB/MazE/SpoVT family DNA-binding domain-containing protein [Methylococcaceae bacterium]
MQATSVISKGQATIPKALRQQLGIRQGSQIIFSMADDHIELHVKSSPIDLPVGGFGMLTSRKKAVPVDVDAAQATDDL